MKAWESNGCLPSPEPNPARTHGCRWPVWSALSLFVFALHLRADQVDMQNGDHYNGKVISMNTNSVSFHSDVLGTVQLPRNQIAAISLGTSVVSTHPPRS